MWLCVYLFLEGAGCVNMILVRNSKCICFPVSLVQTDLPLPFLTSYHLYLHLCLCIAIATLRAWVCMYACWQHEGKGQISRTIAHRNVTTLPKSHILTDTTQDKFLIYSKNHNDVTSPFNWEACCVQLLQKEGASQGEGLRTLASFPLNYLLLCGTMNTSSNLAAKLLAYPVRKLNS